MIRSALFLALAVVVLWCPGCGKSDAILRNDLKQVGLEYHNYHDAHQQGPPNWEEFIAFAEKNGAPVESFQRVKDAGYQVQWGVKFADLKDGLSNSVMAKPPGAGPTLMMDGSVQ